jgi:hypothetical protein
MFRETRLAKLALLKFPLTRDADNMSLLTGVDWWVDHLSTTWAVQQLEARILKVLWNFHH